MATGVKASVRPPARTGNAARRNPFQDRDRKTPLAKDMKRIVEFGEDRFPMIATSNTALAIVMREDGPPAPVMAVKRGQRSGIFRHQNGAQMNKPRGIEELDRSSVRNGGIVGSGADQLIKRDRAAVEVCEALRVPLESLQGCTIGNGVFADRTAVDHIDRAAI